MQWKLLVLNVEYNKKKISKDFFKKIYTMAINHSYNLISIFV